VVLDEPGKAKQPFTPYDVGQIAFAAAPLPGEIIERVLQGCTDQDGVIAPPLGQKPIWIEHLQVLPPQFASVEILEVPR